MYVFFAFAFLWGIIRFVGSRFRFGAVHFFRITDA